MTALTTLDRPYAVRIWGQPVPQGSMTCVGRGGFHNVQPSNKRELDRWRVMVNAAGRRILEHHLDSTEPLIGPVGVEIIFTVPRPRSVAPGARPWPTARGKGSGDLDKLVRAVLDGLCPAPSKTRKGVVRLLTDDAQVVELIARKVYPDTPYAPEALPRPGAVIRIYPIT